MSRSEIDRILTELATTCKRKALAAEMESILENRRKLALMADCERRGVKISWNAFYKHGWIEELK